MWQPEMKAKNDTQTLMDPGASMIVAGGGPALSAWVAEECNRTSGQELREEEERFFTNLVYKANVRELEA